MQRHLRGTLTTTVRPVFTRYVFATRWTSSTEIFAIVSARALVWTTKTTNRSQINGRFNP